MRRQDALRAKTDASAAYTAPPSDDSTRLHGWLLVAARAVAFAIVALTLAIYALALPGFVPRMSVPCHDAPNSCLVTPEQVAPLAKLSITPHGLAVAVVVFSCLAILMVSSVAVVLLWRRSDDWMALLVAVTLMLMPAVFTPIGQGLPASWQGLGDAYNLATFLTLFLLAGIFPNGRFVPRWLWLPVLIGVLIPNTTFMASLPNAVGLPLILAVFVCLIAGQIYRYRRISSPVQRQQTKWAVSGIILTLVVNQMFWQPAAWIPALQQPDSLYSLLAGPDSILMIAILAISFGVAILRYRLYEIDVIIRRTLIYGSLTAILAGVYIAGVIGVQAIVNAIARRPDQPASPVLIVITTLLIAALFQPLRHTIQRFIDRRFYRSKYDTHKTLEAFSAALRQEVELSTLTGQLVNVVTETMQPEHISLWIRDRDAIR